MTVRIAVNDGRSIEDPDFGLVIRSSPFRDTLLSDVTGIEAIRRRVANSTKPDDIDSQLGQLLVSAIIFGALLDRSLWGRWLVAIVAEGGSEGYISFTIDPEAPRPPTLRWFFDPITKRLLEGFRTLDGAAVKAVDPDACAAAFLTRCIGVSITLDDLAHQAETWWRLRIPGLFVGYANRRTTSVSVPSETWRRLEIGRPVTVAKRPQSEPSDRFTADEQSAEGSDIARLIETLGRCGKKRFGTDLRAGAIAACNSITADLETGLFASTRGKALARWQCERLVPKLKLSFQQRGGVGVKHASRQLKLVAALFRDEPAHEVEPDGADLEELYLEFIEQGAKTTQRANRMKAIYSFHVFMERVAGWPFVEFDFKGLDLHATADAALIGSRDYERARQNVSSYDADRGSAARSEQLATMRRCILALGFRAGLRMSEVMEISMNDLHHELGDVELLIRSNSRRKVKTKSKTSHRLLPLHLFLTTDELDELVAWHQLRMRSLGKTHVGHRLFALGGENERLKQADAEDRINQALKKATGDQNAIFHHLRHSFGSYLLATLSLPAERRIVLPNGLDESCISQSRRTKLLRALTGYGLGRSALYAVSALLGHARTPTTLHTYIHLLDWGLSHYLARPVALSDVCQEAAEDPKPVQKLAKCPTPSSDPPLGEEDWVMDEPKPTGVVIEEWRGLARSVADLHRPEGTILLPRRFGIDLVETIAWEGRMTEIAKLKTQQGSRRHRVFRGPTDSGSGRWFRAKRAGSVSAQFHSPAEHWPLTVPRNGPESSLMDLIWPQHKLVETDNDVRQCVTTFLAKLDPIRCDVPLRPEEVMKFYRALLALGIPHNLVRCRPQYQGSPNLNPRARIPLDWDGVPDRLMPPPQRGRSVSRIRMSVVGDDRAMNPDAEAATYGWRYAMVLLAATSTIDIAAIANPPRSERTERRKRKAEHQKLVGA